MFALQTEVPRTVVSHEDVGLLSHEVVDHCNDNFPRLLTNLGVQFSSQLDGKLHLKVPTKLVVISEGYQEIVRHVHMSVDTVRKTLQFEVTDLLKDTTLYADCRTMLETQHRLSDCTSLADILRNLARAAHFTQLNRSIINRLSITEGRGLDIASATKLVLETFDVARDRDRYLQRLLADARFTDLAEKHDLRLITAPKFEDEDTFYIILPLGLVFKKLYVMKYSPVIVTCAEAKVHLRVPVVTHDQICIDWTNSETTRCILDTEVSTLTGVLESLIYRPSPIVSSPNVGPERKTRACSDLFGAFRMMDLKKELPADFWMRLRCLTRSTLQLQLCFPMHCDGRVTQTILTIKGKLVNDYLHMRPEQLDSRCVIAQREPGFFATGYFIDFDVMAMTNYIRDLVKTFTTDAVYFPPVKSGKRRRDDAPHTELTAMCKYQINASTIKAKIELLNGDHAQPVVVAEVVTKSSAGRPLVSGFPVSQRLVTHFLD